MPILSTTIALDRRAMDRRVVLEHTLDDGSTERETVEFVPLTADLVGLAIKKKANRNRALAEAEAETARQAVADGVVTLSARHGTRDGLLRAVLAGFLEAEPSNLVPVATWLRDTLTDAKLDASVGPARRVKLRARQARILRMAADLDIDRLVRGS